MTATNLVVEPRDGVLTAEIDGRRVPLLSADFKADVVETTRHIVRLPGTEATLADGVVAELNERLGVDVFQGGLRLGRLTTSAYVP